MLNNYFSSKEKIKIEQLHEKLKENQKLEEQKREIELNINEQTNHSILKEAKSIDIEPSLYEKLLEEIKLDTYESFSGTIHRFKAHENLFNLNLLITVVGKRRTGKTHFVNDFLYNYFKGFNNFLILTDTKFNNFWTDRFPSQFVKQGYDDRYLQTLFNVQARKKQRLRKKYPNLTDKEINYSKDYQVVVILDDVIGDVFDIRYGKGLVQLATMGRHIGCTVIFVSQYFYSIPSAVRGNTDIAVILNQSQEHQIEGIAQNYLGFIDFKVAKKLIEDIPKEERKITEFSNEDYFNSPMIVRVMMIAIFANRNSPSQLIYWYSAAEELPVHKFMDQKYYNFRFFENLI